MEITNSKGYADLQAVMAMARQKNAALSRPAETQVSTVSRTSSLQNMAKTGRTVAEAPVQSSKLVDRFYGTAAKKQEQATFRIGSRFDAYA
jgi:hypothetical protein